eukprot:64781-Chlamydomonas_euryale.AAC.8
MVFVTLVEGGGGLQGRMACMKRRNGGHSDDGRAESMTGREGCRPLAYSRHARFSMACRGGSNCVCEAGE